MSTFEIKVESATYYTNYYSPCQDSATTVFSPKYKEWQDVSTLTCTIFSDVLRPSDCTSKTFVQYLQV